MDKDFRSIRIDAGLTQAQVARVLGVTRVAVNNLELRPHSPKTSTLARYYAAVGRMDLVDPLWGLVSRESWAAAVETYRSYLQSTGKADDSDRYSPSCWNWRAGCRYDGCRCS